MSKVFRAKYVATLKKKIKDFDKDLANELFKKEWMVYARRPFANTSSVIEYLGRYTHKIAISNHRIKSIDAGTVTFSYKDYRKGAQKNEVTLGSLEFIRRFAMHILPKQFVRIRHYGILSSTNKKTSLPVIKAQAPPAPSLHQAAPRTFTPLDAYRSGLLTFNPKLCPLLQNRNDDNH